MAFVYRRCFCGGGNARWSGTGEEKEYRRRIFVSAPRSFLHARRFGGVNKRTVE